MSKKKKKKSPSRKSSQRSVRSPGRVIRDLGRIQPLLNRGEWDVAIEQLEELHSRFPSNVEVLTELVNACYETNDIHRLLRYVRKLHPLMRRDGDVALNLGGAYLGSGYPFAGYHYLREFTRNFPDHYRAADVRESLGEMEENLAKLQRELGVEGEAGYELGYLHDLLRADLELGDFSTARQTGRQIMAKHPDFAPVYNNLSQIEFMEGNHEQALAYTRRVLTLEPDNFQASANLTRYLFLLGHVEEAHAQAEHLASLPTRGLEFWVKQAEAFTHLGEHARVDEALRKAQEEPNMDQLPAAGLLYHLGAVAALSMGDEKLARIRWQQALQCDPHMELARANLDDLARPRWQRHAPWPYPMRQWLPTNLFTELLRITQRHQKSKRVDKLVQEMQSFLDSHPVFMHVFAILLKRGDKTGRDTVIDMTRFSEYPPLFELLREYVISQDGPDESRLSALNVLNEFKQLPSGHVRMWIRGDWQEILALGFEIGDESEVEFPIRSEQARTWLLDATYMMHDGKFREAQKLLEQAREREPEHPGILNNLAKCLEAQDDSDGADKIMQDVIEKFPNYFFGQIGVANQLILDGKLDEVRAVLDPLLQRQKLHYSEFFSLADTEIRYQLAVDQVEGAESWLDMWRQVEPDHPGLHDWERRIALKSGKGMRQALADLLKQPLIGNRRRKRR